MESDSAARGPATDSADDTDTRAHHSAQLSGAADLQKSLTQLSRLSTGRSSLRGTLTRVAELAVQAVPGADGAGLTLLEANRPDTIVATAPFVAEVDRIQYGLGQGPCVHAAISGLTVRIDSLGSDKRWPQFASNAARIDVHSVLSLPLATAEGVAGSLNIYAHANRAFTDEAVEAGELFSVPAAHAVLNAQVLAQTQRLAAQLQQALSSRSVIDRAVGILMSRSGVSVDEAFARLRTLAHSEHQKLSAMAQSVVDQAVRRARSRHSESS